MVVKTEGCAYTEYKIYPGHGQRYVGRDMKTLIFITKKAEQLFHQKIKPAKLTWTQAWRRMNKKGKVDQTNRRKNKKTTKVQKAIVGLSLEDIKRKKKDLASAQAAAVEQAKAEAKKRIANKGTKSAKPAQQQNKQQVSKNAPRGGAGGKKNAANRR